MKKMNDKKIAVIRIRGSHDIRKEENDTLNMLNLRKKFTCVVVPKNNNCLGMIKKVKDFVTFGEISEEIHNKLIEKRGKKNRGDKFKKIFHLHPPRGGFERKGIKTPYAMGGALGNRKEKINDLILRML